MNEYILYTEPGSAGGSRGEGSPVPLAIYIYFFRYRINVVENQRDHRISLLGSDEYVFPCVFVLFSFALYFFVPLRFLCRPASSRPNGICEILCRTVISR